MTPGWGYWVYVTEAATLTIAILFAHAPKSDCKPAPGAGVAGLFPCRSVE